MNTPTPIKIIAFIGLLLGITSSQAQPLDKQAIKAIDLQITQQPLIKLGLADAKTLRAAIIANLSQWQFPLKPEAGKMPTHTLTVDIGDSTYGETPVGFSFSSGNSDPRALGYQKANVIPIQCRLTAIANPRQEEQLEMTFSAPPSGNPQKLQENLTENISSVCFDLLDSLKFLPPPTSATSISKPTWIPSIQVETVPIPQIESKQEKPSTSVSTSTTASPTNSEPKPVTQEPEEARKQIIIHNQGTPMILKLGHERQ